MPEPLQCRPPSFPRPPFGSSHPFRSLLFRTPSAVPANPDFIASGSRDGALEGFPVGTFRESRTSGFEASRTSKRLCTPQDLCRLCLSRCCELTRLQTLLVKRPVHVKMKGTRKSSRTCLPHARSVAFLLVLSSTGAFRRCLALLLPATVV